MNRINIDVANLIVSYTEFTITFKELLFVNKWWNNVIKKSLFLEKYFILQENIQMYLEDTPKNNYDSMCSMWEKYNSWKWNNNSKLKIEKDIYVDVLDKVNCWCSGIIKNIIVEPSPMENFFEKKMHIRFLGWSHNFDETVKIDKIKPFGTKTIHPFYKYDYLKKIKDTIWILHKYTNNNNWAFAKLEVMEVNNNNIIVCIDQRNYLKITKENIEEKIRICSNGSSLLSRSKDPCLFNRKLKF